MNRRKKKIRAEKTAEPEPINEQWMQKRAKAWLGAQEEESRPLTLQALKEAPKPEIEKPSEEKPQPEARGSGPDAKKRELSEKPLEEVERPAEPEKPAEKPVLRPGSMDLEKPTELEPPTDHTSVAPEVLEPSVPSHPPELAYPRSETVEHARWVEIKPYPSSKLEPRNLAPIVDFLYLEEPFRFLAMYCESERIKGAKVLRYFLEVPQEHVGLITNRLGLLGMYAESSNPPPIPHDLVCEMELARDYVWPLIHAEPKAALEQPSAAENIAAALCGGETPGALEVTARADSGSARRIARVAYNRHNPGPSLFHQLIEPGSAGREQRREQRKGSPLSEDISRVLRARLREKLFSCRVRIYAGVENVHSLLAALPVGRLNRLRICRSMRGGKEIRPIKKPSCNIAKRALKYLAMLGTLGLLGLLYVAGLFNPLRMGWLDWLVLGPVVVLLAFIHLAWRIPRAIVLSTSELSNLLSLPTNFGRLPVEFAKYPTSGAYPTEVRKGAGLV